MHAILPDRKYLLAPAALFLFVLPFRHSVAVRVICLLLSFAVAFWVWRNQRSSALPLKLPILLWAFMACLSLAWADNFRDSFDEIRNEILYTILAFFTFYQLTRSRREWDLWMAALALGLLTAASLGIAGYLREGLWPNTGLALQGGIVAHTAYLALIFPFLLLALTRPDASKPVVVLLLALVLITGYMTASRAFWLVLPATGGIFLVLYARSRTLSRRTIGMLAASAILVLVLMPVGFLAVTQSRVVDPNFKGHTLSQIAEQDQRWEMWRYSLDRIAERPFTGTGFGKKAFVQASEKHFGDRSRSHAHNLFLNAAVQMGIGGLAALLVLLSAMVLEFRTLFRSPDFDVRMLGITGITLVVALVARNLTDDTFGRGISLLFWSLVGMTLGYGRSLLAEHRDYLPARSGAEGSS